MNFRIINRVEITTSQDTVNTLLGRGWILLDVVTNNKKEYSFLLASYDEGRWPGNDGSILGQNGLRKSS